MSAVFRELLKKIGSGPHTGRDLTREEAKTATLMILRQEATPAQIGAFMIAHRIKRPTGEELAGMLDAYDELCPRLSSLGGESEVVVLGTPYDGRSRTAPVTVLTALILAASGLSVLLHGAEKMPTKYGLPLVQIGQDLGVDFPAATLPKVQQMLEQTGLGFFYTPSHFPDFTSLITYRDEIGKRPPFATLELIWSPYGGNYHLLAGYVHPPTEHFIQEALRLRDVEKYTLIKGLEGSCDLPRDRTAIITCQDPGNFDQRERLKIHARDYGLGGTEVPLTSRDELLAQINTTLEGKPSPLWPAVLWNGGFYLWRCGKVAHLPDGIQQAQRLLEEGQVATKLAELKGL
ncbi:anthranilate phosphoribosyltransferase family protein [Spirulina subsalsa FACHB-351]|uniref:Anthranilate phosphoribosyltransferase family protein n=1 Tax=Spirulina subsalsa FACHB-351 TaxID=234711 RepID=A0ABT3L0C9_9CYAN|nr:anthranilate phosphoribosyltransferase family protein [Spirulina subsalsa]MCW6034963.1 anthranilate phosphoribosyltransferase family protein [Spirulina subsalsa FACHB-351]